MLYGDCSLGRLHTRGVRLMAAPVADPRIRTRMEKRGDSSGATEPPRKKNKSPTLSKDGDSKRPKQEADDFESLDAIARQYKKFQSAAKYDLNSEEVFCICRKPDHGGELMISCDGCEEWFHARCMKIDSEYIPLIDKFFCKFCHWKENKVTRWSRKCRRPECLNPIKKVDKSKYCSEACGLKFLESRMDSRDLQISRGEMKFIFNFCDSHEAFRTFGEQFPELPEVRELDLDVIPEAIRRKLTDMDETQEQITSEIKLTEGKVRFHQALKEKIKIINEKVQQVQEPLKEGAEVSSGKKKRTGSKKVDLCCFQPEIDEVFFDFAASGTDQHASRLAELLRKVDGSSDTYASFKDEIDQCVESFRDKSSYMGSQCLNDRRKCLRHNGWYNLLGDRLWKRQHELKTALQECHHKRLKILRDYSISVYEANN